MEQDPAFGIREIVDVALKALSPGVNDISTAVMCVDYLAMILARLAPRKFPPSHRYIGEKLRVIVIAPSFPACWPIHTIRFVEAPQEMSPS